MCGATRDVRFVPEADITVKKKDRLAAASPKFEGTYPSLVFAGLVSSPGLGTIPEAILRENVFRCEVKCCDPLEKFAAYV
jgi:hypothetical protein